LEIAGSDSLPFMISGRIGPNTVNLTLKSFPYSHYEL
jgi:hypothetical protein